MAAKDKSPLILEYIIIMGTMMGSREQGLSTIVSAQCVSATNRPGTNNPIKSLGMNYKLPISSLSQVGPARCGSTLQGWQIFTGQIMDRAVFPSLFLCYFAS